MPCSDSTASTSKVGRFEPGEEDGTLVLVTIRFSFVGLCVLSGVVAFVVFALRMGPKDGFWLALFPIVLLLQYRSRAKRCERLMDVLEVGEERT